MTVLVRWIEDRKAWCSRMVCLSSMVELISMTKLTKSERQFWLRMESLIQRMKMGRFKEISDILSKTAWINKWSIKSRGATPMPEKVSDSQELKLSLIGLISLPMLGKLLVFPIKNQNFQTDLATRRNWHTLDKNPRITLEATKRFLHANFWKT